MSEKVSQTLYVCIEKYLEIYRESNEKVIVLGADNLYMDKVETTIKSICSKNKEVKFYVFNSDLPTEWFQLMDKRLSVLGSEIVNVKVTESLINQFYLPTSHLSSAAYLRYFIPNVAP